MRQKMVTLTNPSNAVAASIIEPTPARYPFPFRYIGATLPIPQRWSRRFEAPSCGQGQARLDRTSMANPHVRRKGARRGGKYRASVPRFAF
jgi:hypothetical protein